VYALVNSNSQLDTLDDTKKWLSEVEIGIQLFHVFAFGSGIGRICGENLQSMATKNMNYENTIGEREGFIYNIEWNRNGGRLFLSFDD
jgi:hypothetical protein